MPRPDRAETRMLYGRRRVPRSHRRVMLAMLAALEIDAWELMRLAQVSPATTTMVLLRLQTLGWAEMVSEHGDENRHIRSVGPLVLSRDPVKEEDRRIRYRLTDTGEAFTQRLLGLDPNPVPGMTIAGKHARRERP